MNTANPAVIANQQTGIPSFIDGFKGFVTGVAGTVTTGASTFLSLKAQQELNRNFPEQFVQTDNTSSSTNDNAVNESTNNAGSRDNGTLQNVAIYGIAGLLLIGVVAYIARS